MRRFESSRPSQTVRKSREVLLPTIFPADPESPEALALIAALSDTLARITGDSGRSSFDPADVRGAGAAFVIARTASGAAVGCGGYRPLQPGVAEVKRMFAAPGGARVGSAILHELERRAAADGYAALWLETRAINRRAVDFYERQGYRRIANFGKYVGRVDAVCFAKDLPARKTF
jgi:GNAT superfamily N-acetyltransferase